MLRAPHTKYARIYTYHINGRGIGPIDDLDLIGTWEEDGKTILIFHTDKHQLVEKLCRRKGLHLFYRADLAYEDWEMGCEIAPFTVGHLTVAPVWDTGKADIKIDPSVVFGNGFHPSTRLCLEALSRYRPRLPKRFTGLDLGCGTGLLAIGAAKLGASSVTAADHNSLACAVTKQNAAYNEVGGSILVKHLDLRVELPPANVDVIMANLHHELLGELFHNPSFWQAGMYILSGFMPGGEEHLLAALPGKPPPFLERRGMAKWRVWVLGSNQ